MDARGNRYKNIDGRRYKRATGGLRRGDAMARARRERKSGKQLARVVAEGGDLYGVYVAQRKK